MLATRTIISLLLLHKPTQDEEILHTPSPPHPLMIMMMLLSTSSTFQLTLEWWFYSKTIKQELNADKISVLIHSSREQHYHLCFLIFVLRFYKNTHLYSVLSWWRLGDLGLIPRTVLHCCFDDNKQRKTFSWVGDLWPPSRPSSEGVTVVWINWTKAVHWRELYRSPKRGRGY